MRILFLPLLAAVLILGACQPTTQSTRHENKAATKAMSPLTYPVAKTVAQVDDYHGTKVADPYRWLEDLDASDTRAWIEAQNKLTFDYLGRIPGRDRLRQRLTELWNYERYTSPEHYGEHHFYTRNDGLQNQAVLYVADSLDARPRLLLDPNTLSADGTIALKGWAISDDGTHVAYGLSTGGSDWEDWHVLDVATAKNTDDVLKWVKFSACSWRRDGTGFFYSRYDEPKGGSALKTANTFQKLYFHRLGTKQSDDLLIYQDKDHGDWLFGGDVSDDGRYLVITVSRFADDHTRILFRDLAKKQNESTIETVLGDWDASYRFLGNAGHIFYFLTDNDAPRYRIIAVDSKHPGQASWKQIVPQAPDTLQNARIVNHSFIAEYMHDAHSEIHRFDMKGKTLGKIDLPGLGTASGFTGQTRDTAHVTVLQDGLKTPTGVEPAGDTLWFSERGTGKVWSIPMPK